MKDGHQIFSIAARSHDLNPMENIFHILQKKLQLVALEMKIERKDFEKSSAQVKKKKKKYWRVYQLMLWTKLFDRLMDG